MNGYNHSKFKYSPVDASRMRFDRVALFKNLRSHIKSFIPNMTFYYGFLNNDLTPNDIIEMMSCFQSENDKSERRIDYAFAYTFMNKKGEEQVWMEAPLFYAPKSLSVYALAQYEHREKEFFDDFKDGAIIFPKKIFDQYLMEIGELTFTPTVKVRQRGRMVEMESGSYWKSPNNSGRVLNAMSEMAVMYNPKHR